MKNKKVLLLMIPLLVLLAGCGTAQDNLATGVDGFSWATLNFFITWIIVKISTLLNDNLIVGLILATILVRLLMVPAYAKQIKSQEAMQEIQPQVKKIQKKYEGKTSPDQRQKMQLEMSALYKKEGVSPFAGCLPTLLQMPVLFVFYGAVRNIFMYTQEASDGTSHNADYFIAGKDLSTTLFGFNGDAQGLIVLALFVGVGAFLSTWVGTIGQDKNAPGASTLKTMLYIMPIMMAWISYTLVGAMGVYLLTGSIFSFFQSLYFKREKIIDHYQKSRIEKNKKTK